jgi:hypothetical protein
MEPLQLIALWKASERFSYADDFEFSDDGDEPFYFVECRGYKIHTFDIAEDINIDIYETQS